MPLWTVTPEWQGQDVCIIGGGASLVGFDFPGLRGSPNIACNDAYKLGPEIAPVCLFGDAGFFERNKWTLEKVKGTKFASVAPAIMHYRCPWLQQLERVTYGWGSGHKCGWWYNTGTSAINLAVNLGAARVFLLGFDLCKLGHRSHWHSDAVKVTEEADFQRHIKGFEMFAKALQEMAPGVPVLTVAAGPTRLDLFPTITVEQFWEGRNGHH